jgi:hypothetical protein
MTTHQVAYHTCPVCSAKAHSQDELHGKGVRVHNVIINGDKHTERCTVCGHEFIKTVRKGA